MDKALLHSYICSGNLSVELQAACTGVTMDMLLGWISADKVAQQVCVCVGGNVLWHQHRDEQRTEENRQ